MQIYFHSRLCSYLSRVPILVEGTVYRDRSSCSQNSYIIVYVTYYYYYYSTGSTMEHSASTTVFQWTLFWATLFSWAHEGCIHLCFRAPSPSLFWSTHSSLSLWVPLQCLFSDIFRAHMESVAYSAPFPLSYFLANRQLISFLPQTGV